MKLVGLIVVILGAGVWLMYDYSSQPKPGDPVPVPMPLACEACGEAWAAEAGVLPVRCIKCGEKKAYHALQCGDCDKVFPWKPYGSGSVESPRCTYCKSGNYHEVDPEAVGYQAPSAP